jgi:hypothetical protein
MFHALLHARAHEGGTARAVVCNRFADEGGRPCRRVGEEAREFEDRLRNPRDLAKNRIALKLLNFGNFSKKVNQFSAVSGGFPRGPQAEQSGIFSVEILSIYSAPVLLIITHYNRIPSDRSLERIDAQIERIPTSTFQRPMEIERVKISRSTRNHGTVTKPVSALSSGNFIKGSKEKTEILSEARRYCALKNRANPIEKGLNICAVASEIVEYSSESHLILLKFKSTFSVLNIS